MLLGWLNRIILSWNKNL